jgi:hypothetical protein
MSSDFNRPQVRLFRRKADKTSSSSAAILRYLEPFQLDPDNLLAN